ncbi:MAG: amino acid adenylation domain-containing protein, partial [Alphaproteobacteria bacterium]|nr:amino acid adenylation domain-containing protein [Alphaproteobacteria bacterium]
QDVPFEQLVDHLNIPRVLNRNPVFQVRFTFESIQKDSSLYLENILIYPIEISYSVAKFDLFFNAYEHDNGIDININYATDLFEERSIERLANHFKKLIQAITKDPSQFIHDYLLLIPPEQHQLLIEWNDTRTPYPEDKTIHQLFEEQVKKTPHNVAVVYEGQEFTYQELNERANQLAQYLRSLGVGPDTLVAIAVERSLEMIIDLLGILKAGGAYVPLDPSYPQNRLQFMLDDTQAPVLLTQSSLKDKFKSYIGKKLNLHLDSETKTLLIEDPSSNTVDSQTQVWTSLSTYSLKNLHSLSSSHNLAYVIYTSGSTGNPKGVMVEHKNFFHYISYAGEAYPLSNEPTLFHSSPAFDMSITSLFLPLIKGNSIDILPDRSRVDALADTLKTQYKFSFIKLTPTHLKALRSQLSPEHLQNQKGTLIIGGENLLKDDMEFWLESAPGTSLFNEYGPTEATVGCCVLKVGDYDALPSGSIPIGRPISNTQIYILDPYLNPVPVGVSGEIYIGGVGLTRGYLNRPELTAERFIPNPFANNNIEAENYNLAGVIQKKASGLNKTISTYIPAIGSIRSSNLRLYRTGDLARYLPDGNIEFLGRIDDQVKIRGFRIELGEIESVLQCHEDVSQVVIMAREDEPGNKKLVAYIVPRKDILSSLTLESTLTSSSGDLFSTLNGETISGLTEDLRNHLIRSLPDYMVPSFFVFIDKVPLTPNGKIDRKALPAPDLSLRQGCEQYAPPTTPLEKELCAIWSEVLRIEKIGLHDNFFKLGGHSLLATQVISRIRHNYNIDIPLRALFEQPTIAALCPLIESLKQDNTLSSLPLLLPQERKGPIPLSFAQQRLWFLDQLLPEIALYNVPLALKLKGLLNTAALERALNTLIERHESLRTIFPSTEGEAHQEILPHLVINLAECSVDLTLLKKKEQKSTAQSLAQQEATTPFNLSTEPLIRVKLLILAKEEHILLITLHHIISDGWSMEIFFKELSILYNAYELGKDPSLPSLLVQYADFALWQREWLQGEVLEQQLSYWKHQLAGIPDLLDLPTDKPRPKELTYKGAIYHTTLSKQLKDNLNKLSQDYEVSLFMTLLAAFQVLLYRYTGQKDIVVGSPIANRHYKEIEGLIGFFVNTLALRTTFEGNETFLDVLNRVKETTLQAYQHQDVPFEQLVDHLNVTRELNRNPVFQVMFTLDNVTQGRSLGLKQIQTEPFYNSYPVAKFDLFLNVDEGKEGLEIGINYAMDLFEAQTIERMGDHFKELIEGIIKNPTQDIQTLPLLTQTEKHQLLIEWNDTRADYPEDKTIHQLFEEQVERTPDNIAIVYEDQELTYQQLNEKANQLAHYLRTLGVGPDTLVAIAIERSLEMIIGLLGILKAGGAYVPLDPSYPQERLQFMLQDTNSPVFITQSHLQDGLKETLSSYKGKTVVIDQLGEILQKQSILNSAPLSLPHHLAYVIYTSGSTGKPKGVMVGHRGLTNFLMSLGNKINIDNTSRLLGVTTLAFDIAGLEIYSPLLNGGTFILISKEVTLDPIKLTEAIDYHDVTIMQATPTIWQLLIDNHWKGKKNLKALCGGEAINLYLLNQLVNKADHVWNLYGPTEITIWSNSQYYTKIEQKAVFIVSIGAPIWNTQIYILDSHLSSVPVGISGEIYIAGEGLARGYLNRPDLTAERFVPNPFINEISPLESQRLRLYRTGDLARYLPDGNIEFLGRIDDQIKIRGFRIELGEIESTLTSHTEVAQAVVTAREDEPDYKRLVAYVVPQQNNSDTANKEGISRWQNIYNDVYKDVKKAVDITFNTVGWNSSYTGKPIPDIDMGEWVENTVNQILSLKPKRILEIGCGTGLLLSRIAPHCQAYWGTDFSERVINHLNALREKIPRLKRISLLRREANNFKGIKEKYFDVIILNSVSQYFPNIEYLKEVLKGAARSLRRGGIIFIGDVRNLSLLKAYASSVECFRAAANETKVQIKTYINQRLEQEKELVINPRFFITLQDEMEGISHIRIQPKRGVCENELTKFRYDVQTQQIEWLAWDNTVHSLTHIEEHLIKNRPSSYGLQHVYNVRLQDEKETLSWLRKADEGALLKDLSKRLRALTSEGVNPENLWLL